MGNFEQQVFIDTAPERVLETAKAYADGGWRFVQLCGTTISEGVELIYTFVLDGKLENLRVNVADQAHVPSISDFFLQAFVFENETHDLFGITFDGIAIDFGGKFYTTSVPTPMNPRVAASCMVDTRIIEDLDLDSESDASEEVASLEESADDGEEA